MKGFSDASYIESSFPKLPWRNFMSFHFVPLARDWRAEALPTVCVQLYTILARLSTPESGRAERFPRHAGIRVCRSRR